MYQWAVEVVDFHNRSITGGFRSAAGGLGLGNWLPGFIPRQPTFFETGHDRMACFVCARLRFAKCSAHDCF
jgi:hypothetical protein